LAGGGSVVLVPISDGSHAGAEILNMKLQRLANVRYRGA
jgi:hypothetical protein